MGETQQSINVSLDDLESHVCSHCGSKYFDQVTEVKKLSQFVSPDGQEKAIPMIVFICHECGQADDEVTEMMMRTMMR